ncbi:MAG: hypothetical protein HY611_05880, partial [Elusimicrobia bacterium]|nr:hypothetical protein [Elusimicrobiota bacterium]
MFSRPDGRRLGPIGPAAVFLAVPLLLIINNIPFWSYLLSFPGICWEYLGLTLWTLCQGVWIFLALWGAGRFILDFAPAEKRDFCGSQALAFSLGLALTAHLLFLLGLLQRLRPAFAWGLLILQTLAAWRGLWSLRRRAPPETPGPRAPVDWLLASLMAFCLWAAWHALAGALAPPSDWDSLAYHLPIAKAVAKTGALASMPWMLHSRWPSAMELLYAWTMLLGDHRLSQILHAACGLAAAWLLWAAAGEIETRREKPRPAEGLRKARWCAAALFLTLPVFTLYAPTAHNDLGLSLMVLSSLFCQWKVWSEPRTEDYFWPALAGCFAGFAASIKYHGLFWAAASLAAIPLRRWPVFLCAFGAAACPWYLRSWILTGNPVWPFAYRWFGGPDWSPAAAAAFRNASQLYWNPGDAAAWLASLFTDFGPPFYSGFFALPAALMLVFGGPPAGSAARISIAVLLYLIPMAVPYG